MTLPNDVVANTVSKLVSRLAKDRQVRDLTEKEALVIRLEKQYPADIGVLSIFFLNYLRLAPGEAVCLGANEPHAYLAGEIVECMAASDNVVRAGFTPKYRDTQTLCSMLTYKQCVVQHYEWGRIGAGSEVGRLHALASGNPMDDVPYAELWMGTHTSGPSRVVTEKEKNSELLLKDWLASHPEALGLIVLERWEGDLPFLFKVLSVAKALSIQAHPDKKLAQLLHKIQPQIYKDPNHKPEMALALTPFEALCGFVPPEELKQAVETVPELRSVLGEDTCQILVEIGRSSVEGEKAKRVLKEAYTTLMTLPDDVVAHTVSKLVSRLAKDRQVRDLTEKEALVIRLEKQYPADIGVLSIFFLNYLRLAPGEAVCLGANEPHAYLAGEIVECMAASDNVVRAGFTPKYRDTQTLCSMLTYKQGRPEVLTGTHVSAYTTRYTPPFTEFEVDHILVPLGASTEFENLGPSIFLVFDGIGAIAQPGTDAVTGVTKGDVFFVPAAHTIEIVATVEVNKDPVSLHETPLRLYRAGVNSCLYHPHHVVA